jgi:hypothetical protein
MFQYRAPDGSIPEFVYSTTLYTFTLPAGSAAAMITQPNEYWEQVALLYLQGYQLDTQLGGSMDRPVTANIYAQPYPQQVILTGWHKEGEPSSELPWLPSEGSLLGPNQYGWRDTTGQPYDDLVLYVTITPPVDQFDSGYNLDFGFQASTGTRAYHMGHQLTYFSTLAEAGQTTLMGTAAHSLTIAAATDYVIDAYLTEGDPREATSPQAADLLTCELVRRAHTFESGSLRDRLLEVARNVRRRCDVVKARAARS